MGQRKTATVTNAARVEKLREAWQLRVDGWTVDQIARHFRVAQSTASRWLAEAYERRTAQPAAALKAVELDKLDQAERAALQVLRTQHVLVSGGKVVHHMTVDPDTFEPILGDQITDDGPVLQALDRLLKIAQRRAALLGLDAPTKVDTTGEVSIRHEVVGADPDLL